MIEVKDLEYTYTGNNEKTLKGINFTVNKGEIFGFLGPSGAGKSTLQKIIIGILKGYRGSVKVAGQEVSKVKNSFYEKIGVSFELPNLYGKFTALENLKFFSSFYSVKTEEPELLLSMVGLNDDKNTRVSSFSKGMKMRLNFCRALLNKPDLIFLDEPTSGLDPVNAKNLKNIIQKMKSEGKTVFLTTTHMNIADELCDRVAFIVDGKIDIIDSPRTLKIRKGKKSVIVEFREKGSIISKDFGIDGIGTNEDFARILREKEIETIHTQEATLEDIFIEVTGRSLS
jgi:fluoroquinolone transport system ATP-binding protein